MCRYASSKSILAALFFTALRPEAAFFLAAFFFTALRSGAAFFLAAFFFTALSFGLAVGSGLTRLRSSLGFLGHCL